MLPHGRGGHAVAHRVQAERHRATGALEDPVGNGLQTAGQPQAAEAFGEVNPRQSGVVAGATTRRGADFGLGTVNTIQTTSGPSRHSPAPLAASLTASRHGLTRAEDSIITPLPT